MPHPRGAAFRSRICHGPPVRKRISGPRALLVMLGILVATVIPWIVIPTVACRGSDPVLDDLGAVGTFQLTDERGERFTEDALSGHVTLVSFLFTRCDTICP